MAIEASLAWAAAKNEIIVALQEGRIQASGIRVGTTVRAKINAPEWADLQFKLDSDQAMATNSLGIYGSGKSSNSTEKIFSPIGRKSKCNLQPHRCLILRRMSFLAG